MFPSLKLHILSPDRDTDEIAIDGTIKFCEDLDVNPKDVVLLAVVYELKPSGIGAFPKEGWVDGWKRLQWDSIPKIKDHLAQLTSKLVNDTEYFQSVYNFTRASGAYVSPQPPFNHPERWVPLRSSRAYLVLPTLAVIETAIASWGLLLPAGQRGQALRHMDMITDSSTGDVTNHPSKEPGWKPEYNALWFEYLPLFLGSFR
jgi:DCN1-like protein 1/2